MGINHPKLQMVERLLKDHFQAHANDDTRYQYYYYRILFIRTVLF
jgi:ERCC4-related helicase